MKKYNLQANAKGKTTGLVSKINIILECYELNEVYKGHKVGYIIYDTTNNRTNLNIYEITFNLNNISYVFNGRSGTHTIFVCEYPTTFVIK